MDITVRFGTREDIDALVEVECSGIKTWYHYSSEGRGAPTTYEALSSMERIVHGGPWIDLTVLRSYWEHIDRLNIIPLIAEIDEKIVGHLDVLFSDELPLGKFLFLDILAVHKEYRRRGVASELIKQAENLAKLRKVDVMLVTPQAYEGPSGLTYRNYGFKKYCDTYILEIPINHLETPSTTQLENIQPTEKAPIKTHTMISGWNNISKKMWDYSINPNNQLLTTFSIHHITNVILINEKQYFFYLQNKLFTQSNGSIFLWAPLLLNKNELKDIMQTVKTFATQLGIQTLKTRTLDRYVSALEYIGFTRKSKGEPYLIKNLG